MMDIIDQMLLAQHQQIMDRAMQNRQQQAGGRSGGTSPMQAYNMYQKFAGSTPAAAATSYNTPSAHAAGQAGGWADQLPATAESGAGSTLGYVAAAIAAQHLMSNATDRRTNVPGVSGNGHRTGDVFSLDFFTEPWQGYAYEKLGMDFPSPGEKTDAAINAIRDGESGWDNLLRSAPATGAQWFDPVGSFGYDWLKDQGTVGKIAGAALMPVQWLTRIFD